MIQDISPHQLHNEFQPKTPEKGDILFYFREGKLLVKKFPKEKGQQVNQIEFPRWEEESQETRLTWLFTLDGNSCFLGWDEPEEHSGYQYESPNALRHHKPKHLVFAALTAYHLYGWYQNHRYCGRCGERTVPDEKERMLRCPSCGNMMYPGISPAVIVGVIDGEKILMTRYAGRSYKRRALIAGFTEIGETLEETVQREVMEEVGLRVKNISYYKNQPWGLASNLLVGYFAELDGDGSITLDETELSEGEWVSRGDISTADEDFSLTREMMAVFAREGRNVLNGGCHGKDFTGRR